ncbi:Stage III sporulation protein AF (Spore_III_AF) [Sporobacter termitidis DSM 10068]|uniref:Stage III sporulation protein AF (Spore_III_AF) n=1 Tax=Sporobacter termitidis DSM 10068 TaxID=1123282 RepID=A0A1M5Y874_9FIRM|nr:hypothetical protein [Sporobacter termitidis]SHI08267.1 Stage III sporulation protein AF (Spore_III_AF) [Sporobacter termitidis DSM 10068]
MTEALRSWIIGLAGAAMVTAVAMTVTPEGRVKKVVSLICGLVTIIALIKPIVGFNYADFAKSLASYQKDAEGFSGQMDSSNEKLTRLIIEDKCATYILDKGKSLDMDDLEVTVTASWSEDGYWYPSGARLTTNADKAKRDKLGQSITSELGIPPEELIWSMRDEK